MGTEFSEVFASLRTERRLSQRKAAEDLGISQALLSHYENGIRQPRFDFVVRACKYYGVSADYLLGITDIRRNPADDSITLSSGETLSMWTDAETRKLSLSFGATAALAEHECGSAARQALLDYISTQLFRVLRFFEKKTDSELTGSNESDELARALAEIQLARYLAQLKKDSGCSVETVPQEFTEFVSGVRAKLEEFSGALEEKENRS